MLGSTRILPIGIIRPPPDIQTMAEKTAIFVAKNGQEFERKIMSGNANNPIFNFLEFLDPYHAYYRYCLSVFRSQTSTSQQPAQASLASAGEI